MVNIKVFRFSFCLILFLILFLILILIFDFVFDFVSNLQLFALADLNQKMVRDLIPAPKDVQRAVSEAYYQMRPPEKEKSSRLMSFW